MGLGFRVAGPGWVGFAASETGWFDFPAGGTGWFDSPASGKMRGIFGICVFDGWSCGLRVRRFHFLAKMFDRFFDALAFGIRRLRLGCRGRGVGFFAVPFKGASVR